MNAVLVFAAARALSNTRRILRGAIAAALALVAVPCFAVTPAVKLVSGANQHTPYGSAFAAPLVVQVTDAATKKPLAGAQVNFTPGASIGLSSTTATTDANGLASVTASGLAAGTSSVTAQVPGYSSAQTAFGGLIVNKVVLTVIPTGLQSVVGVIPAPKDYYFSGFVHGDTLDNAAIMAFPR